MYRYNVFCIYIPTCKFPIYTQREKKKGGVCTLVKNR